MNFDDTPEEAAFRAQVRARLDANAPKHLEPRLRAGSVGASALAEAKAWQKKKAEAGYGCPSWPKDFGGGGMSPIQRVIWDQEEDVYSKLSGVFGIGHGMCGPTVMTWASEEHKAARLPPLASGEEIWCQLFSEPSG